MLRCERGGLQPDSGHVQPAAGRPPRSLRYRLFTASGTGTAPALLSQHWHRSADRGTRTDPLPPALTPSLERAPALLPRRKVRSPRHRADPHVILPRHWHRSDSRRCSSFSIPGTERSFPALRAPPPAAGTGAAGPGSPGFPGGVGGTGGPSGTPRALRMGASTAGTTLPRGRRAGSPVGTLPRRMRGLAGAGGAGVPRGGGDSLACGKVRALKVNLGRFQRG